MFTKTSLTPASNAPIRTGHRGITVSMRVLLRKKTSSFAACIEAAAVIFHHDFDADALFNLFRRHDQPLPRDSIHAQTSDVFHAVVRGPSLQGLGKSPFAIQAQMLDFETGINFRICGKRKNPVAGRNSFTVSLFLVISLDIARP